MLRKAMPFCLGAMLSVFALQANAESDAIRLKVRGLLANSDRKSITDLMNSEYQSYKSSPSVEGFNNLWALAEELYGNRDDQPTAPYWMFRNAAWKVILAPLPPITDPETDPDQPRAILNKKRELLFSVMMTSRPNPQDRRGYDVSRRHDAAMLLLSYASWLRSDIVPNYQWKAVAPTNADLPERLATRQNAIDNEIQSEMLSSLGRLSSEYFGQIRDAYGGKPRNEAEAKALVDALNMPEILKQEVLKYAREKR